MEYPTNSKHHGTILTAKPLKDSLITTTARQPSRRGTPHTMDAAPLTSLSLTHVSYNASDPLSHLCAWLALLPQTLCVIYVTLLYSSREIEILLLLIGQIGCEVLNFGLKRLIRQERPEVMNGKGYGMPSSHAQFMSYFAVSLGLFLLVRHRPPGGRTGGGGHGPQERVVGSLAVGGLAAVVAGSRVYLSYHTPIQVVAGCVAGAGCALAWFAVTWWLRRGGWVDWALETKLAELGRWRDLVVEEDLPEGGWRRWMDKKDGKRKSKRIDGSDGGAGRKQR